MQKELIPYEKTADLGALAHQNTINYAGNQITNKPTLGALAAQNYITTDNIQYEQYLFVDASRGSDSNPGDNVNYPLKTIYAAIQKAKSPATTMIQIYPGTYTEMPNINNKNIDLYSLSEDENNPVIIETPIYASESTIYLYGIMKITGINATGSTIMYFSRSGSYLHTISRIDINGGSILNVFPGIYIDPETEINTTALDASSGSIITLGTVTWAHAPNPYPTIGTVMHADNGIIQYVDFDMSLMGYGTLKSESNNGRVFQIMNYPEPPDPSIVQTKFYLRATSKDQFGYISRYWSEAGPMVFAEDAPPVSSYYGSNYVRKSYMIGNAYVHDWVDMDPPMDTSSSVKKKWVRVRPWSNVTQPGGWQELDEPPTSDHSEAEAELYARASYMVGNPESGYVHAYKWVKIN